MRLMNLSLLSLTSQLLVTAYCDRHTRSRFNHDEWENLGKICNPKVNRNWSWDVAPDYLFVNSLPCKPKSFDGQRFEYMYVCFRRFRRKWHKDEKFRAHWDNSKHFRRRLFNESLQHYSFYFYNQNDVDHH
ncbi:hypothetical protein AX774_g5894 [Zancudomyces culisetae]|uniref:Uncharacterized protein n=1 Tax=Zancudomyces culisetae TaxID=1213189 RepID=A0A1R1PIA8_ZANCU|nr:hypothetical protein AX774_g5894 [Zancudomyces culisetae]|eukprot:OMH80659.1 hypothetical protein AX774_g5894 [Zancudomyces culisetae]